MRHAEFNHPTLVQVYDAMFGWSRDDDFFMSVVDATPPARVLDLGCGTGRLTLAMAAAGHTVTGVDPAGASLDAARIKTGAENITWIQGSTEVLPGTAFDVAVMTSHVAQFFVSDEQWDKALTDLHRSLVPGGKLAFDTRDPRASGWKRWNPSDSRRQVALPDGRRVTATIDVDAVTDNVVSFTIRYAFSDGQALASTGDLRFRTEAELRSSLAEAGFAIEEIYGGWNREPIGAADGELLVIARA